MPVPRNSKELQRLVGLFAYYAQWIPRYSHKIRPVVAAQFPLGDNAVGAIKVLKDDLSSAALGAIDETLPFVLETDASDNAISATLNQQDRPVAFFSRTLTSNERRHVSVEKEALAIVEAVRKWAHLLTGRRFKIVTDQRSVAFMYDNNNHGKIKNDKVLRWRMELSEFAFDIAYRSGKLNAAPDALSLPCVKIRCTIFMCRCVILASLVLLCSRKEFTVLRPRRAESSTRLLGMRRSYAELL